MTRKSGILEYDTAQPMGAIKIITILKDDTLQDILGAFRQASAGEVILVLPRAGKVLRREDHFSVLAAEASGGNKTVSILTADPQVASWAQKYHFTVMHAGRPSAKAKKTLKSKAVLASQPPPEDDDIQDLSEDAFQGDVPGTSDETMGNKNQDEPEADPLHLMHVENEGGNPIDEDKDEKADEFNDNDLLVGELERAVGAPVSARLTEASVDGIRGGVRRTVSGVAKAKRAVPAEGLDYIDAVWRDKIAQQAQAPRMRVQTPSRLSRLFAGLGGPVTGRNGVGMSKRVIVGILVASIVLLGAAVYMTSGAATVTIIPTSKPVNEQVTVQASDVFLSVDAGFNKIPGQLIEVSKSATQVAQATGQRDVASKARGKITIYNNYSSVPQGLVATTRFESTSGLVFRTLQTVSVPGTTVKAGKTVPGIITVDVIADQPGPTYNIPAGNFVIAAFREHGDQQRVEKIYGVSSKPMTGGASGPSQVVTQADYDTAVRLATKSVSDQIVEAVAAQGADLMIIGADKPVIGTVQTTARPDDATDSFTVSVPGTLKTVAFRKADLEQLVQQAIMKNDRLTVAPDQLKLSFGNTTFKPDVGVLVFTVTVTGPGYLPVDRDTIAGEIRGKNRPAVQDYFKNRQGIASATVTLSPFWAFWVRSVPEEADRITVHVDYQAPVR